MERYNKKYIILTVIFSLILIIGLLIYYYGKYIPRGVSLVVMIVGGLALLITLILWVIKALKSRGNKKA
ncbi:MAG: hypothetical protein ACFE8E_04250 [Candidatus Hodarchaeota archaeon]